MGNDPKRRRMESPLLFGNPDPCPVPPEGSTIGSETRKLIISTCHSIVKLETNINKLEAKSQLLEQHRLNGTAPKDLLLPKKKSLFEDLQPQVDEILKTATNSLLMLRISEVSRKMSEVRSSKASLEKDLLSTLQTSRDTQLKFLSPDVQEENVVIVNQRHSNNIRYFYSQLAIARENAFIKSKRCAEKEAKKKSATAPMDTTPDARVVDVLDQRLKQLGLIGRNSRSSRSRSPGSSNSRPTKPKSRSGSDSGTSRGSSFSSASSRSSSRGSRGRSRGILKQKKKKTVKFDSRVQKNGGPTTPIRQKKRRRGRENH